MSLSDRLKVMVFSGIALVLLAGCGAPAGDDMPADMSAGDDMSGGEMSAFMLPPPGITGTPADDATDPALNNLPNPNATLTTNWGPLPDGRVWGSTGGCRYRTRRTCVGL